MADLFQTTLQEAAYEGVVFPVSDAKTEGGHDSVEHTAYRRRGTDVEPTGQQPYRGTLSVPLVNGLATYGDLFPQRYFDLLSKFESTPIGTLSHPTKGTFKAHIKSWPETVSPNVRSGVMLEVHWVEHAGEAGILLGDSTGVPTDSAASATAQAIQADTACSAVTPPVVFVPIQNTVAAQLAFLEATVRTYAEVISAVGIMVTAVNATLNLTALSVATAHPAVLALERLRGTIYRLQDRYLATRNRPRLYTVPFTQPIFVIAQRLYGDASKATLLMAANSIADPMYVAAGTVLTVLPVT